MLLKELNPNLNLQWATKAEAHTLVTRQTNAYNGATEEDPVMYVDGGFLQYINHPDP